VRTARLLVVRAACPPVAMCTRGLGPQADAGCGGVYTIDPCLWHDMCFSSPAARGAVRGAAPRRGAVPRCARRHTAAPGLPGTWKLKRHRSCCRSCQVRPCTRQTQSSLCRQKPPTLWQAGLSKWNCAALSTGVLVLQCMRWAGTQLPQHLVLAERGLQRCARVEKGNRCHRQMSSRFRRL
jgi:hypothetical protein